MLELGVNRVFRHKPISAHDLITQAQRQRPNPRTVYPAADNRESSPCQPVRWDCIYRVWLPQTGFAPKKHMNSRPIAKHLTVFLRRSGYLWSPLVSGESADRLGDDHVNLARHARFDHAIKLFVMLGVGARKYTFKYTLSELCGMLDSYRRKRVF